MNDVPNKVLIIDDSPNDIHVLLEQIGNQYQVTASTTATKALDTMRTGHLPDVILMDVNMPQMNGYEACSEIKNDPQLKDVDIIFISANDNPEEIIRGLDAGAIDYIVKPFDPHVIRSKLRRVIDYSKHKSALKKKVDDANKMVYSVMNEAGHMGVVLNFLRNSFQLQTTRQLLDEALQALTNSGLDSIVFFKRYQFEELGSNGESPTFLEMDLIDRAFGTQKPLIASETRLLVSRENTVIYIKNLPEDPEKAGTLKDTLMILIEGINSKLENLCDRRLYENRRRELQKIVETSKQSLIEARSKQADYKHKSMDILDSMVKDVEQRYYDMGLTLEQEQTLSDAMQSSIEQALNHFEQGMLIDGEMEAIVERLAHTTREEI